MCGAQRRRGFGLRPPARRALTGPAEGLTTGRVRCEDRELRGSFFLSVARRSTREGAGRGCTLHLAAGALEVFSLHNTPVRVTRTDQVGAIRAAGWAPNRCGLFSAHVNGTCRVGTDPLTSGALPTGERHGAPGIYVVDGSLLPTGVGVNPQATILALADCVVKKILAGQ